ncbi:uncharacterized protein At5g08430-like [Humulus lupulus]|uniref:uncharacterized protein At5g08430-like n=1 Tax=Humulus lupulus TaxID=3486 RepID=UPI002B401AC8|nr:uncharacterized protein At5g08430-like [Humulus lupulus]XP_062093118.1 uncharacterized protein At5g08430-like [Humulus lupulus]
MIEPIVWMEEYTGVGFGQPSPALRKRKRIEFSGWGSTALIAFLQSIGRDTTHPISQSDVTNIVNDYVEKNLPSSTTSIMLDNGKKKKKKNKKKVVCDDKLRSLFGKKSISRIMIHKLLEPHLAADQLDSDDDDAIDYLSYANGEEGVRDEKRERSYRPKRLIVEMSAPKSNLKSFFAAVIPENIKLVYLKRSLIEDILEEKEKEKKGEPSTFKTKVVGSFVRTKSDPNDYLQKHSHCLLQVLGVRFSETDDNNTSKTFFQVSGFIKDVPLSLLSDDDFSKEECEDLHQRIKDGMLKRPTVEELQQKAQILHEDMTKHWLARELALLRNLIDRANEKGRRRELSEYLERRELLQTPDEQSKLFQELPKVIAEDIEPEIDPQHSPEEVKQANDSSPGSILPGPKEAHIFDSREDEIEDECEDEFELTWAIDDIISEGSGKPAKKEHGNSLQESQKEEQKLQEPTKSSIESRGEIEAQIECVPLPEKKLSHGVKEKVVIDLSDEDEVPAPAPKKLSVDESSMWHYLDPQGEIQGPFTISLLKNWSDADFFPPDFKIWKEGESPKEAVQLKLVLKQAFPN